MPSTACKVSVQLADSWGRRVGGTHLHESALGKDELRVTLDEVHTLDVGDRRSSPREAQQHRSFLLAKELSDDEGVGAAMHRRLEILWLKRGERFEYLNEGIPGGEVQAVICA